MSSNEGLLVANDNYGAVPATERIHTRTSDEQKEIIKNKLYFSHALYVWNSRVYEFGIVLFIINLFPGTLIPGSLFAFVSTISVILLSTSVTKLVNRGTSRLAVIKSTIFVQRTFAVFSSLVLLVIFSFFENHEVLKRASLAVVIICGAAERLCTIANKLSISRDWIVKITMDDEPFLVELNTRLRGIDLFCKLVGPLFISAFLTFTNHQITALLLIVAFMVSGPLEYKAIMDIYHTLPVLQDDKTLNSQEASPTKRSLHKLSYWQSVKLFIRTPISPIILAMSLLYCTVLSFGNSTVAYLLSFDDINNLKIGVLRGVSCLFELFGAMVVFPFLNRHFGLINTGFVSVIFQFLSLSPIAVSFVQGYQRSHWMVCLFIPFSRVGLWCFDLALQNSIQIFITDDLERFNATSFEESLNNLFALCGYVSTLYFNKPSQFEWPVLMSVGTVGLSVVLYFLFLSFGKLKN